MITGQGELILAGTVEGKVVPYFRLPGKTKWSKNGRRYLESQRRIAKELLLSYIRLPRYPLDVRLSNESHLLWKARRGELGDYLVRTLVVSPFRFGLAVCVPRVKSKRSPNFGGFPGNAGDFDHFVSAFLDAAKYARLIEDDSPDWYHGPCVISPVLFDWQDNIREEGFRTPILPGVYLSRDDKWRYHWTFRCSEVETL